MLLQQFPQLDQDLDGSRDLFEEGDDEEINQSELQENRIMPASDFNQLH